MEHARPPVVEARGGEAGDRLDERDVPVMAVTSVHALDTRRDAGGIAEVLARQAGLDLELHPPAARGVGREHAHVEGVEVAARSPRARPGPPSAGPQLARQHLAAGDPAVAEKHERRAFVRLAESNRAPPTITSAIAVAVHVAGTRDAVCPSCALAEVRLQGRRRARWTPRGHPGGAAQEHERRALVGLARVVPGGADDHVRVAVAVHVAGTGTRCARSAQSAWFDSSGRRGGRRVRRRRSPRRSPRNTNAAPSSVSPGVVGRGARRSRPRSRRRSRRRRRRRSTPKLRARLVRLELRRRASPGCPSAIPAALPRNTNAAPSSVSPAS